MDITDLGNWTHDAPSGPVLIPGVNYDLDGVETSDDFWPSNPVQYVGDTDTIVQRITSTPEPGTLTLHGLGLAAVALRICRRRA